MDNQEDLENKINQLHDDIRELKASRNISRGRMGLGLVLVMLVSVFLYSQYRFNSNQQEILKEQNRIAEMQAGFNRFQVIQDLYKTGRNDTLAVDDLFSYITKLDTGTRRKFLERVLSREEYNYLSQESFKYYFEQINPSSAEYFLKHAKSISISWGRIVNRYVISGADGANAKLGDKGILKKMKNWYTLEHLPVGKSSFVQHRFLNSSDHDYVGHVKDIIDHIVMNINIVYAEGRIGGSSIQTLSAGSFQMLEDIDLLVNYVKEAAFYSPETIRDYVDIQGYEGVGNKVLFDLQDPYLTATYRNSKTGFFYIINAAKMRYDIYRAYFDKSPT
ncbi:MAG: hypothetical protein HEP71_27580, partial [Roseivirga sp.]|nr:hypothetical protein [Roseivirga sp.]